MPFISMISFSSPINAISRVLINKNKNKKKKKKKKERRQSDNCV
jgi:hypothetical protein